MRVWTGFGSEHSANLVLLGHFVDEARAEKVEKIFQRLAEVAESELPEPGWDREDRLVTGMWELLSELEAWVLTRSDLDQFAYDHAVRRDGDTLEITTEELDIQGFLKVLIENGARVEVYSAHEWTADGQAVESAPAADADCPPPADDHHEGSTPEPEG